ncbi:MAG: DUF1573 domain-containing protein [Spirochaetes bacterium]|nr:DUF1573 domain-containing protein [Spirochaetota bacterium]
MPAGGSGQIEVTFKTGAHTGKMSKSIIVYSNDPVQKTVRLTVSATVQ